MDEKYHYRFVLLDFGHPMNENTIKNIINSLENVLVLTLVSSQNTNETNFGISGSNSNFAIIHFESSLRSNWDSIVKSLNDFCKKISGRVTVQEFKNLLGSAIETIFHEHQKKFSTDLYEQFVQIAIVSKKNAWVLSDIITSLSKKLQVSTENFTIVQILNDPRQKTEENNTLINCIFCPDDSRDLTNFFKDWFLNPRQRITILISKNANLEIECEVEDCVFNTFAFCSKFDPLSDTKIKRGKSNQVCNLEIISRLPVNGLCPTLVFGIPRRLKASRWTQSQTNFKLFIQMCRELNRTGQGLLAKTVQPTDIIYFHFLTSDGDMILMNDVAPDELHFSKREENSNCDEFFEDDHDASIMRNCLQKIKFLDEFKPENFSSKIYEIYKNYFNKMEHSNSFLLQGDKNNSGKNPTKKETPRNPIDKDDKEHRGKSSKSGLEKELESVHPALLPPEVVEKYRKIDKRAFKLLEFGKDFL